jgi:hypothetical protein
VVLAALAFVLAGCAHPHIPPTLVVDRAACDRTLVPGPGTALAFDPKTAVETNLRLTQQARCIEAEDGGRDYYAVFDLPRTGVRYTLSVGAAPEDVSLLAPQILLLDGQGVVTRRLTAPQFLFRGNQLTALVQPRPNEARLVVMSDHTLVGQTASRILEILSATTTSYFSGKGRYIGQSQSLQGAEVRAESVFSFTGPVTIGTAPVAAAS